MASEIRNAVGTHLGVGLHIFHTVIIHDAEIAAVKGFGHGSRQFSFSFYYFCTGFLRFGFHLLFQCYGHCATLFGLGLSYVFVSLSLINLQGGADVFAYIDVGDVN